MSTWHNQAEVGDIAESVLLPGDPLRAKFIAEKYLQDAKCFNTIRCAYGYTGYYKGKRVSVMATGMGIPSIGIYSYELYNVYHCKNLIRIGTAGAMQEGMELGDIIMAIGACTDSNYASQFELPGTLAATCDYELLKKATEAADRLGYRYHVGNVACSDVLYRDEKVWKAWAKVGTIGSEMESYGLYCNALAFGGKALAIFTNTISMITGEEISQNDAEKNLTHMIEVALEAAIAD
ncbi:MAG: purine-nucleoside phosphorylase [Erysipelotrichaceae bacterium]|nr:purine-nucleoside phosphorylase [Erysipelotrichaceae bacterium]